MKNLGFLIYRSNIEKIALQKRQQSGKRAKPFVRCILAISLCVSQIPVLGCRKSSFALTLQLILCFFRRHGCGCGYADENCLLCKEERWFRTFCVASRQSDVSQAAARPAHVSKPKSIDKASLHARKLATSASLRICASAEGSIPINPTTARPMHTLTVHSRRHWHPKSTV